MSSSSHPCSSLLAIGNDVNHIRRRDGKQIQRVTDEANEPTCPGPRSRVQPRPEFSEYLESFPPALVAFAQG